MRTLVKNGTVVNSSEVYKANIILEDETIQGIEIAESKSVYDKYIDAVGCYIFPGAVDVHTHFDLPFAGTTTSDDFESGTIAAACGGTTTIVDYAIQAKGESLNTALSKWKNKAKNKAVIDYGFHIAISEVTEKILNEIPQIANEGVTSLKCYMAYKNILMLNDGEMFKLLRIARDEGLMVNVHAENGDIIELLVSEMLGGGCTDAKYHYLSRPVITEIEATSRAIKLAKLAKAQLYIVHISSADALREVKNARNEGQLVYAETCPHYLFFDCSKLDDSVTGPKFVMSPPLRSIDDSRFLWKNVMDGGIDVVATDHATFNYSGQKDMVKNDFSKIPNGVPGVEERFSLLYTGIKGLEKIELTRLVEISSTSPSKIFGLYPKKGTITIGSDADLIIYDPHKNWVISNKILHHRCDYTLYEKMRIKGSIKYVISRGEIIVDKGNYVGNKGRGNYISRKKSN